MICRLRMHLHLCLCHLTTFWPVASSRRLLDMDLVLLHHHRQHHKYLLSDPYRSSLNRTMARLRTYGKHLQKTVLQRRPRSLQFHHPPQSRRFQPLPKHSLQRHHLLLPEHLEHSKMHRQPHLESRRATERLLRQKLEIQLRHSLQCPPHHGLCEQMIDQVASWLQQQFARDAASLVLFRQISTIHRHHLVARVTVSLKWHR